MTLEVHRNMHGFRGVEWCAARQCFRARICPPQNPRGIWLGKFTTAQGAAQAYDIAARKFYGADACLNFPKAGERGVRPSVRASENRCVKGHDLSIHGRDTKGRNGIQCRKCISAASLRRYYRNKANRLATDNHI